MSTIAPSRSETKSPLISDWHVLDAAVVNCFETWSKAYEHAVLLYGGGKIGAGNNPLNRWGLIGLGCRQEIQITNSRLIHRRYEPVQNSTGLHATVIPSEAAKSVLPELLQDYRQDNSLSDTSLPFTGGWISLLHYESATLTEPTLERLKIFQADQATLPIARWIECEQWLVIDRTTAKLTILNTDRTQAKLYQAQWQQALEFSQEATHVPSIHELQHAPSDASQWVASLSPETFHRSVLTLKEHIAQGDIYQANLSIQFKKATTAHPLTLFRYLTTHNPSPFAACLKLPEGWLVSNSPERLVNATTTDNKTQVSMRPIAGTRGRGDSETSDEVVGKTLRNNVKEQAEHMMLVDLVRNDLGRVCQSGSVTVNELLVLERYSHVTHLVSNVQGELASGKTLLETLLATFPGGTITGCPKLRCMEILASVEPVPRNFYTGSLGWWSPQVQQMDHNILIRSMWMTPNTSSPSAFNTTFHVGAGIVHDSDPKHEYKECLRKAQALLLAIDWIENHREW